MGTAWGPTKVSERNLKPQQQLKEGLRLHQQCPLVLNVPCSLLAEGEADTHHNAPLISQSTPRPFCVPRLYNYTMIQWEVMSR